MDTIDPIRVLLSFLFVLGLMALCAFLAKRFITRTGYMALPSAGGRLTVVEAKMLDSKRKLVLVKRDEQEHLLLLSPDREVLIETVRDK